MLDSMIKYTLIHQHEVTLLDMCINITQTKYILRQQWVYIIYNLFEKMKAKYSQFM